LKLIFVGFLPPDSHSAEERTFAELLSAYFERTVVFQGIGVKGLDLQHLKALPSRLAKRHLQVASSRVSTGILPMLPVRRGPAVRLSAWMIRRRLTSLTRRRFDEWVFWTRFPSPELVEAIRGLAFSRVIYEPVDRYAAGAWFSRDERRRIAAAEAEIVETAMVVTTSAGLAKRFDRAAGGSYSLPLGKDSRLEARLSGRTHHIGRPRLAVVGSLDWLADESILADIATQRPAWQLLLAGPRDPAWGRRLDGLPNVHWLGKLAADEARGVIADCDVALNPCFLNEWTESAIPVKIFDYLAEGRPVVSTPMAELDIFRDVIEMAPADQFVEAVERALQDAGSEAAARRRAASERFTLQDRARRAFELVSSAPVEATSRRLA